MASTGNPFLDAVRGTAPRIVRSGSVSDFFGGTNPIEFEAARRAELDRRAFEAQSKAESLAEQDKADLEALAGVYSQALAGNPNDHKSAILAVLNDPKFISGSARTVAEMQKRLSIIQDMAVPKPVEGKIVPEGGILVDPFSGDLRAENPRRFEPKPSQLDVQGEHFNKEFAKTASKHVGDLLEEGTDAQLDQVALDRLNDLGDAADTGAMAVVRSHLNRFGIAIDERTPPLQAYEALLNRLTPQQRQGLPGAASDRDVQIFRGSLPELWTTPAGRKTIVETLSALNQYKQDRAQVADEFLDGQLTYRQFYQKLSRVQDPFAKFRTQQGGPKTDPASAGARNIKDTVVTRRRRLIDANKDIFEDVE